MASILKGQSGQPIQFETKPNVNGDDVTTESAISTPNSPLVKGAVNATGDAPIYACRAWVNFDGTNGSIRVSGNISSITRRSSGNYTISFINAMPDNNYTVSGSSGVSGGNRNTGVSFDDHNTTPTPSNFRINVRRRHESSDVDAKYVHVQVFR